MRLKRVCYLVSGGLLVLCVLASCAIAATLNPFASNTTAPDPGWPTVPFDPMINTSIPGSNCEVCSYNTDDPLWASVDNLCTSDGTLPLPPDFICNCNFTADTGDTESSVTAQPATQNTEKTVETQTLASSVVVNSGVTTQPAKYKVTTVTSTVSSSPPTKTYSVISSTTVAKPKSSTQSKNSDEITTIDGLF